MKKRLNTLVDDIYAMLEAGVELSDEQVDTMAHRLAGTLKQAFGQGGKSGNYLRMSNIGQPCKRKLWYVVNHPEMQESFHGKTLLKFAFGHIIEDVVLTLAEAAGHEVRGTQDELTVAGVKGHRDAIVDDVVVDVKSANSRSFLKFAQHKVREDDAFGYLPQLSLYHHASVEAEDKVDPNYMAFIAVDKELGGIHVDEYIPDKVDWEKYVVDQKIMVHGPKPGRHYSDIPDGKSGNMVIPMPCKYCPFKDDCWKDANGGKGLRKVIFSNGPRWFTTVVKEPQPKKDYSK